MRRCDVDNSAIKGEVSGSEMAFDYLVYAGESAQALAPHRC
jgi:hypothetical protein